MDRLKLWCGLAVSLGLVAALTAVVVVADERQATIEATTFPTHDASPGDGSATCPAGRRATGGGILRTAGPPSATGVYVRASGPLDASGVTLETKTSDVPKQWYAAVFDLSGVTFGNVQGVFAICAPNSSAKIKAKVLRVDSGETGEAFAKCPAGQRALGGGMVPTGATFYTRVNVSGPLDASGLTRNTKSGDVPKQWYAAVTNTEAEGEKLVKVFAICAPKSRATIKSKTFTSDTGETGDAFAKCPAGSRATGGGVVARGAPDGLYVEASGPLDASGIAPDTEDGDVAKHWWAVVSNYSGQDDRSFKVFVICV